MFTQQCLNNIISHLKSILNIKYEFIIKSRKIQKLIQEIYYIPKFLYGSYNTPVSIFNTGINWFEINKNILIEFQNNKPIMITIILLTNLSLLYYFRKIKKTIKQLEIICIYILSHKRNRI